MMGSCLLKKLETGALLACITGRTTTMSRSLSNAEVEAPRSTVIARQTSQPLGAETRSRGKQTSGRRKRRNRCQFLSTDRDSNVESPDVGRLPPQQSKRSDSTDRLNAYSPQSSKSRQEQEVIDKKVLYANLQSLNRSRSLLNRRIQRRLHCAQSNE